MLLSDTKRFRSDSKMSQEGQKFDRTKWLQENNLGDSQAIFDKRDVKIHELLEFSQEDLKFRNTYVHVYISNSFGPLTNLKKTQPKKKTREFAKDVLKLDVLARNRLLKAIKKLRGESGDIPGGIGGGGSTQYIHVVVSMEEHDAMAKLYQLFEKISSAVEGIQTAVEGIVYVFS